MSDFEKHRGFLDSVFAYVRVNPDVSPYIVEISRLAVIDHEKETQYILSITQLALAMTLQSKHKAGVKETLALQLQKLVDMKAEFVPLKPIIDELMPPPPEDDDESEDDL